MAHRLVGHLRNPWDPSVQFDGVIVDDLLGATLVAQPEVTKNGGPCVEGALVILLVGPGDIIDGHESITLMEFNIVSDLDGPGEEVV